MYAKYKTWKHGSMQIVSLFFPASYFISYMMKNIQSVILMDPCRPCLSTMQKEWRMPERALHILRKKYSEQRGCEFRFKGNVCLKKRSWEFCSRIAIILFEGTQLNSGYLLACWIRQTQTTISLEHRPNWIFKSGTTCNLSFLFLVGANGADATCSERNFCGAAPFMFKIMFASSSQFSFPNFAAFQII